MDITEMMKSAEQLGMLKSELRDICIKRSIAFDECDAKWQNYLREKGGDSEKSGYNSYCNAEEKCFNIITEPLQKTINERLQKQAEIDQILKSLLSNKSDDELKEIMQLADKAECVALENNYRHCLAGCTSLKDAVQEKLNGRTM